MQKALHTMDATYLCMWYGMDKIQQKFLSIAGLLLFTLLFFIIFLATGFSRDYQPDISALVVILFIILVVVAFLIIINRIYACSRFHTSGKKADEKQETLRK
jgi:hypothetical protein